jgi:ketosteroid isomerase-like protein
VPDSLTPGDGHDLFARFKKALEKRDPDRLMELYAEDAEYRVDPFMASLTGANAIREHWNAVVASEAHVDFDVERIWVSGRTVLASWHGAYTRSTSGDRVRARGFSTIELDDEGLVSRWRDWTLERHIGSDSKFRPDLEPATEENQDGQ